MFRVISHCPQLKNESGHVAQYARALGDIFGALNWQHMVLLPCDSEYSITEGGWKKVLPVRPKNRGLKVIYVIRHVIALNRFYKKQKAADKKDGWEIFLLEAYTYTDLLVMAIHFLISRGRKQFCIALVLRNEANIAGVSKYLHLAFFFIIESLMSSRLACFTDSSTLADLLAGELRRNVYTLPIPHASKAKHLPTTFGKCPPAGAGFTFWWPGAPRPEKGTEIIRNLVTTYEGDYDIRLKAAETADLPVPGSPRVALVGLPDPLQQSEYENQFETVDIVLLPYDERVYAHATSGIFVESVVAGIIPFVSDGTWMAYEAKKFGVPELIVDWQASSCLQNICELATNVDTKARFAEMSQAYAVYHSSQTFGQIFASCIGKSFEGAA